jgi:acetyl esterase/lipase
MLRNLTTLAALVLIGASSLGVAGAGETPGKNDGVINLWPDKVPLQKTGKQEPEFWNRSGWSNVHTPTLTLYPAAKEKANGIAVLIIPGGSYSKVCINHEGHRGADWLNKQGISAFVLKYRMKPYNHPVPLMDAQRAMRWIRSHAAQYGIDPEKIGVMGFSAGGHLAASLSVHYDMKTREPEDAVDALSARPNFSALIYPVISMRKGLTHGGSRHNLIGPRPTAEIVTLMSTDEQVGPQTPPAFLVHGTSDTAVKPANSERYLAALKKHGIPGQLVLIEGKGHGFGLGFGWPEKFHRWILQR